MPTPSTQVNRRWSALALACLLAGAPALALAPVQAEVASPPPAGPSASHGTAGGAAAEQLERDASATGPQGKPVATSRRPLRPAQGSWHEHVSAHFRVLSDAPAPLAAQVVEELERLRASLVTPLGLEQATVGVDVILFADREGYARYAGSSSVAKTSWRTRRPLMLLAARGPDEAPRRALLAHELTHALSHEVLGRQPRWGEIGRASCRERVWIPV